MKYFDPYYISDELFNIIFLCGCKFSSDKNDKRRVLKKYLEKKHSLNVIILEEHFNFEYRDRDPNTLYYDDIFFKDLSQIETMAALFANKVYIIHESISTAAELGLFAGNSLLFPKIELIVPNIPDKPMTTFIRWAFFRNPEHKLEEIIKFTPNIEEDTKYDQEYDSVRYLKAYYKTYFKKDELNVESKNNLNTNIDKSINLIQKSKYSGFRKTKYKLSNDSSIIEYEIKDNKIKVHIGIDALKIQLLSLLYDKDVKAALQAAKSISKHVSFIEKYYKTLMQNTITTLEAEEYKDSDIEFYIKGNENNVKLRAAIGLFLYFLQALGLISINKTTVDSKNIETKLSLKVGLDKFKSIKEFIRDDITIFERRDIL